MNRLRTPQFARRKRRVLYVKAGVAVVFVGMLVAAASYVAHLPALQIREVAVQGAEVVDVPALERFVLDELSGKYLFLFPKSNVLLYPKERLKASVMDAFTRLESVTVERDSLHRLTFSVTERAPEALWCGDNRLGTEPGTTCYFLDADGYLYTKAPSFTGPVYVRFYGPLASGEPMGQPFLTTERFRALMDFMRALEQGGLSPAELAVIDDTEYELYLADGTRVYFSGRQPLDRVLDNLLSVFSSEELKDLPPYALEYIDLRFGNKVYYKLR